MRQYVSRAGEKLAYALDCFGIQVRDLICADLGSSTGGFVDCLLQRGAGKIYAIDTGYGALAWKLRRDPRVVVMERTNALHAVLPERVALVSIDVAWTRQKHIVPAALRMLRPAGRIITLIKPHYEADASLLRRGVLGAEHVAGVLERVWEDIARCGACCEACAPSPLRGAGGNAEFLALLRPAS